MTAHGPGSEQDPKPAAKERQRSRLPCRRRRVLIRKAREGSSSDMGVGLAAAQQEIDQALIEQSPRRSPCCSGWPRIALSSGLATGRADRLLAVV